MKKSLIYLLLVFTLAASGLQAQEAATEDYVRQNYNKREVMITMRDGVKLFTSIYEPRGESRRRPIMLTRTPYSSQPYGKDYRNALWQYLKYYTAENYIIVFQDVRGRYLSEGTFDNERPYKPNKRKKTDTDEASDTYDTAEWLVKNTNSNGNIGVQGVSYPGFYTFMAALSAHPAIKAVSPQAPVTAWFHGDDIHHNGAFFLVDTHLFTYGFDQPRKGPGIPEKVKPLFNGDIYSDYLKAGAFPAITKLLGDSIEWWPDVVAHPDLDDFWKSRDPRQHAHVLNKQHPAVLVVGGTFDAEDLYGTFALHRAIKEQAPTTPLYLAVGPWNHGGWHGNEDYQNLGQTWFGGSTVAYYQKNIEYPFFSYYLDGKGQAPQYKAELFYTGENRWHQLEQWPLQDTKPKHVYLQQGGRLSGSAPSAAASYTSYVSDPAKPVPYTHDLQRRRNIEYLAEDQRFAEQRPDVVSFTGEPLSDALTVAGPVEVELYVSLSTTDADFVVKLIDVYPYDYQYPAEALNYVPVKDYPTGGYEQLVRGDVIRGKYRQSLEHPEPFKPGEVTLVKFTLPDVSHTFLPGHQLQVQIQSSWFPLVDRNPQTFTNIYQAKDSDFQPSTIRVWHASEHASRITIPVVNHKETH